MQISRHINSATKNSVELFVPCENSSQREAGFVDKFSPNPWAWGPSICSWWANWRNRGAAQPSLNHRRNGSLLAAHGLQVSTFAFRIGGTSSLELVCWWIWRREENSQLVGICWWTGKILGNINLSAHSRLSLSGRATEFFWFGFEYERAFKSFLSLSCWRFESVPGRFHEYNPSLESALSTTSSEQLSGVKCALLQGLAKWIIPRHSFQCYGAYSCNDFENLPGCFLAMGSNEILS